MVRGSAIRVHDRRLGAVKRPKRAGSFFVGPFKIPAPVKTPRKGYVALVVDAQGVKFDETYIPFMPNPGGGGGLVARIGDVEVTDVFEPDAAPAKSGDERIFSFERADGRKRRRAELNEAAQGVKPERAERTDK